MEGFKKRTPFEANVDVQASYSLSFGARRMTVLANAFNIFNRRVAIDYNSATEYPGFGIPNPDFGQVNSANVSGQMYQAPFRLQLGARFEF